MSLLGSIFAGYKASPSVQKRKHNEKFEELGHYPMLFSSDYLNTLYYEAETPEECDELMAYLFRFDCVNQGIESYDKLFHKTTNKYKKLLKEED